MGCASLQTQTTPCPLCEVLSGRICWWMGHRCLRRSVCAWPEVCVCFLSLMAPDTQLQLDQSSVALDGPGWGPPNPLFSSTVGLSNGWTWVKNLIMKFKTSHNIVLRLFRFLFLPLFFSLSLCCLWSIPAKQAFEVVKALALLLSPQSTYVTGREELEGSNVTPT